MRRIIVAAAAAALMCATPAFADVSVTQIDYRGWPGAYRMSNGDVELVYVPQIGRIMRYALLSGPTDNALWNNPTMLGKTTDLSQPVADWQNYGGDKLWCSPQDKWKWPPDPSLESAPQEVTVTPDKHLVITSRSGAAWGVKFRREISLAPSGPGVTLDNTMTNSSAQSVRWGIWEVAQIDDPQFVELPVSKSGRWPDRYYTFPDAAPDITALSVVNNRFVAFTRNPAHSGKIGSDRRDAGLTGIVHGLAFTITGGFPRSNDYPDSGCTLEVWSNTDPDKYMEMEMMGPVRALLPGQSTTFSTHWTLAATSETLPPPANR